MQTKQEVFFLRYRPRYQKLHSKVAKSALLTEIEQILGLTRKHILKKLREGPLQPHQRQARTCYYGNDFKSVVLDLWEQTDYLCAELFHPFLHTELTTLLQTKQFSCTFENQKKLRKISIGTLKNIFTTARKQRNIPRGISTTRTTPAGLKLSVAIRTSNWDITSVGWHETDYVSHCGHSASAPYLSSLNFVDIRSKWCSLEVVKHANQEETFAAFQRIEKRLPYALHGINPDNGTPFINLMMVKYYQVREDVEFTRSRAYHKNDNALVERKNCTIIRKYTGYRRYESDEAYGIIKEMYQKLEIYLNFFQKTQRSMVVELPNRKLKHKRLRGVTPYQLILRDKTVSTETKRKLTAMKRGYRVLELIKEIRGLKSKLFQLEI